MAYYDSQLREKYTIALRDYSHSISKVLPSMVSKYGLGRNVNFWSYIRENPNDRNFAIGPTMSSSKSKSWGAYANAALGELGGPRYAPKAASDTMTPQESAYAKKKRYSRRLGGRAKTILTGELEPETSKRTLLG